MTESSTDHEVDPEKAQSTSTRPKRRKKMFKQTEYKVMSTQLFRGKGRNVSVFDFWIGDSSSTAIYKKQTLSPRLQIDSPVITLDDLRWCFNNSLICPEKFVRYLHRQDVILNTITSLSFASEVLNPLPRLFIRTQCLGKPLLDSHWAKEYDYLEAPYNLTTNFRLKDCLPTRSKDLPRYIQFQVLAHMVCGYDIHHSLISSHIMGLSFEDSIFIPASVILL